MPAMLRNVGAFDISAIDVPNTVEVHPKTADEPFEQPARPHGEGPPHVFESCRSTGSRAVPDAAAASISRGR